MGYILIFVAGVIYGAAVIVMIDYVGGQHESEEDW